MSDEKPMGQVIQIDEARIRDHLGEMVRGTVEETLNAMLDAEADQLCGAGRYERSQARQDTRAGSYDRTLQTSAGEVNLKIPKLRRQTFETAIIERYRRRESSVEESLIEMYLAGISVRRVEDITEALWGTRVSPSTVSNLNKKIYAKIEAWRNRRIEGEHPYLYLDGIGMKRTWAGEVRNVSLLVAIGVNRRVTGRFWASARAPRRTSAAKLSYWGKFKAHKWGGLQSHRLARPAPAPRCAVAGVLAVRGRRHSPQPGRGARWLLAHHRGADHRQPARSGLHC